MLALSAMNQRVFSEDGLSGCSAIEMADLFGQM
jgi:hypothetical protein